MEFLAGMHPIVIHFPIAFLSLYVIVEIAAIVSNKEFLQKSAYFILVIGVVMTVAAVLTGNQAEEMASRLQDGGNELIRNAIENHEEFATITLWFFTGVLFFRTFIIIKKSFKKRIRYFLIPLVLLGGYLIYQTGNYGGKLVYDYGVGTKVNNSYNINGN